MQIQVAFGNVGFLTTVSVIILVVDNTVCPTSGSQHVSHENLACLDSLAGLGITSNLELRQILASQ